MKNIADVLCVSIASKRCPVVVGLDPVISRIPDCYIDFQSGAHPFDAVADAILAFNKDVIDAVCDWVPAVKPQMGVFSTVDVAEVNGGYSPTKDDACGI